MGTHIEVVFKTMEVKTIDEQKSIIDQVYVFAESKGLTIVKLMIFNPDPTK